MPIYRIEYFKFMEECREAYKTEKRRKDTNDKKTVKTVLDKKTIEIIDKLKNQGMIIEMHGEISVGKEACVYLATASSNIWSKLCKKPVAEEETEIKVAVKIYKTSAMVFKDREKYIVGERRFRNYPRGNSRKLVKIWAEKEVRNLNRLQNAGIPSPKPLFLRRNIIIMSMIGDCEGLRQEKANTESSSPCMSVFDEVPDESFDSSPYEIDSNGNNCSTSTSEQTESMSYTSNEEEQLYEISYEESSGNGLENISLSTSSGDQENRETVENRAEQSENRTTEEPADELYERDFASSECSSEDQYSTTSSGTENDEIENTYELSESGGVGGVAPNLKSAALHGIELQDAYNQVVILMKRLHEECGLVHADLSEYNMLYWEGVVHIIDVGQSVERDHSNAREFLAMDISNVNRYFSKLGATVLSDEELLKEIVGDEEVLRTPGVISDEEYRAEEEANGINKIELLQKSKVHVSTENETKEEKKLRKKETKEKRREKRENKITKKEKKTLSRKARILKEDRNK